MNQPGTLACPASPNAAISEEIGAGPLVVVPAPAGVVAPTRAGRLLARSPQINISPDPWPTGSPRPPSAEPTNASSGVPIPPGGLRVRASLGTVQNGLGRRPFASVRPKSVERLEKLQVTVRGQRAGPHRRGRDLSTWRAEPAPSGRGLRKARVKPESSPKAERAGGLPGTRNFTPTLADLGVTILIEAAA